MQEAIGHTTDQSITQASSSQTDAGQGTGDSVVSLLEKNLASGPSLDIRMHRICGKAQGKSPT